MSIADVFELTNTCTQNRSFGVGTAGENYFNLAWNIGLRQKARDHVMFANGLEAIRCVTKEGDGTPTAQAGLFPNLTYSGPRSVGKFQPETQISGPPVVGPCLGFVISTMTP